MLRKVNAFILVFCLMVQGASAQGFGGEIDVTDGDTIRVGGVKVRLHGIDAPEQDQSCETEQGPRWACGAWVTEQVRARYQGVSAACTPLTKDRYGRVVARCLVGDEDVGRWIVRAGLAFAFRKYSMDYDLDEKAAAINDRGLHASRVQRPAQHRITRAKGRIPPDARCKIKGNISSKGVKIYHVPGQADYERTGIREAKGERWFCSAEEARAAGWRAALR